MERAKTGIPELDKLLGGGVPRGHSVIVCGTPGSGKTILGFQFVYGGALNYGENGVYISFEETESALRKNIENLGWNVRKLEGKGLIKIIEHPIKVEVGTVDDLLELIDRGKPKRLVLDSWNVFNFMFPSDIFRRKREIMALLRRLKKMDTTIFVISEMFEGNGFDRFPEDSSLFDGIIFMVKLRGEARPMFSRYIHVAKMRGIDHDLDVYPFRIEHGKGIVIYPKERLFE